MMWRIVLILAGILITFDRVIDAKIVAADKWLMRLLPTRKRK